MYREPEKIYPAKWIQPMPTLGHDDLRLLSTSMPMRWTDFAFQYHWNPTDPDAARLQGLAYRRVGRQTRSYGFYKVTTDGPLEEPVWVPERFCCSQQQPEYDAVEFDEYFARQFGPAPRGMTYRPSQARVRPVRFGPSRLPHNRTFYVPYISATLRHQREAPVCYKYELPQADDSPLLAGSNFLLIGLTVDLMRFSDVLATERLAQCSALEA